VDFDGDGRMDILSGSWPGELYCFRNGADGKFVKGEKINDKNGKVVKPGSASTVFAVDYDGDGDLDLLCGNIEGEAVLYSNEGTKSAADYAAGKKLEADGTTIKVKHGDSHPVLADWDNDGKHDLIVGTGAGGVMFYRNTGTSKTRKFAAGAALVAENEEAFGSDKKKEGVGTRVKVCVCDYNGDGRLDLLVGDFSMASGETPKQTEAQKKEEEEAQAKFQKILEKNKAVFEELRKASTAPAKETPEAKAEREKKLKELQAQVQRVFEEGRPFQEVIASSRPRFEYHGWVWLLERKSTDVAGTR
jgi:hypothetical protein